MLNFLRSSIAVVLLLIVTEAFAASPVACLATYVRGAIDQNQYSNSNIFPTVLWKTSNSLVFESSGHKQFLIEGEKIFELPTSTVNSRPSTLLISAPRDGKMHYDVHPAKAWSFTTPAGTQFSLFSVQIGDRTLFRARLRGEDVEAAQGMMADDETEKAALAASADRDRCIYAGDTVDKRIAQLIKPIDLLRINHTARDAAVKAESENFEYELIRKKLDDIQKREDSYRRFLSEHRESDSNSAFSRVLAPLDSSAADELAKGEVRSAQSRLDNQIISKSFADKLSARCSSADLPATRPLSTDQKLKNQIIDHFDNLENTDYLKQFKESNDPK